MRVVMKKSRQRSADFEKDDACDNGTHGTYARPHGIGGAYGECLGGLVEQEHTYDKADEKAAKPYIGRGAGGLFSLAQAECEAGLEDAGDHEYDPVHGVRFRAKVRGSGETPLPGPNLTAGRLCEGACERNECCLCRISYL